MKCVIVGCGWLGFPLGESLHGKGYTVAGSVRSQIRIDEHKNRGIDLFIYDGKENTIIPKRYTNSDILVLSFPPSNKENYPAQIHDLIEQFSSKTHVIFTSSTGVYSGVGNIDEESEVDQNHPVFLAEKEVMNSGHPYTILRLSGLIGGERHPVRHLSGRELNDGQQWVNLVHRDDVIRAIEQVINKSTPNTIFNICYPHHPTRNEYYTLKSNEFGLLPPLFNTSEDEGKIVSGKLFMREYCFVYSVPI